MCRLLCRCGDLYGDAAVDTFNACAVSDQKCVPQRADEGVFPVPPDCALDKGFDLNGFTGRWYITAGLNPLFDTFDCQVRRSAFFVACCHRLHAVISGAVFRACIMMIPPPWQAMFEC